MNNKREIQDQTCHCGRQALYTVRWQYIWRATTSTATCAERSIMSHGDEQTMHLCPDCYPDTAIEFGVSVPPL